MKTSRVQKPDETTWIWRECGQEGWTGCFHLVLPHRPLTQNTQTNIIDHYRSQWQHAHLRGER